MTGLLLPLTGTSSNVSVACFPANSAASSSAVGNADSGYCAAGHDRAVNRQVGCIQKAEVIAYPDLGPEAVHRLYVKDFPVVVVIDSQGNNLYETGREEYLANRK